MPRLTKFEEYRDRYPDYALEKTEMPQQFISMMTKLTDQNLSEADPGRLSKIWFYSHPPHRERVMMAQQYLRPA